MTLAQALEPCAAAATPLRRAEYDRLVNDITNSNRAFLIKIYYPFDPPEEADEVALALENNDVWKFKAAEWLRELLDVWEEGSAKITRVDREQLEALPWFRGWMEHELDAQRAVELHREPAPAAQSAFKRKRLDRYVWCSNKNVYTHT